LTPIIGREYNFFVQGRMVLGLRRDRSQAIAKSKLLSLRNLRNEMTKKARYYFFDTGIHNALVANFNPFKLRNNISMLWEYFLYPRFVGENAPRQVGP
jgi:hypothetical protein